MDDYKAIESGKDYLAHHGVKGMKWGIRHDPVSSGEGRRASKKLKKAADSTVRKVARRLKRASRTSIRAAKRVRNRSLQRKIEKAIASGNSTKINKVFSKMNDAQAARAVVRINQREVVLRARAEDGKRSLRNINMQRKIDTLNLRNQYNKAKHPNLYTAKDNAINSGSKVIGTKLGTAISETLISEVKKAVNNPGSMVEEAEKAAETVAEARKPDAPFNTTNAINVRYKIKHSDFVDFGEDYLSHHGVKGMKWGIRHDEERIGKLKQKKSKVEAKLVKAEAKRSKFKNTRKALRADKAEIKLAKRKRIGLLKSIALTKAKKLDFKVDKFQRKVNKLDKKIVNAKADRDYHKALNKYSKRSNTLKELMNEPWTNNDILLIGQYQAKRDLRNAKLKRTAAKKGKNSFSYKFGKSIASKNMERYGRTFIYKDKNSGAYEFYDF